MDGFSWYTVWAVIAALALIFEIGWGYVIFFG